MSSITLETAVGVFSDQQSANAAVESLYQAGYTLREIGVITRGELPTNESVATPSTDERERSEGAAVGAITGMALGGLIGLGVLAGVIPVVGPALFAGTLGVLAANAGGGAVVAGVIGALTGWGIPQEHAQHYEAEVAAGRTIVTVTANHPCDQARAILQRAGATSLVTANSTSGVQ
ncbi:MAG: hypothetical protein JWN70_2769 [Planctomycetaceae bacterium]|nr:hypothetical protein [Planctomycetaceae bacterium]